MTEEIDKYLFNLFRSFSIPSIKTDEIERSDETDKYLSIFFNPLNLSQSSVCTSL